MTDHTTDATTLNEAPIVRVPAGGDECGPMPLTEAELDHVAAAGSKPGTSGAQIPRPQR